MRSKIRPSTAYKRVAHQLVFLAREYGQEVPEGIKVMIPLRHQDLADLLESTRESITRTLSTLRARGLLAESKDIVVTNLKSLSAEAYSFMV